MKIRNICFEVPFWDDDVKIRKNGTQKPWFKKGKWKRILRKRFIKRQIKINET